MLLSDFQQRLIELDPALAATPDIRRTELQALFEAASLAPDKAAQAARLLALAWDLHPEPRPLWFWADDRYCLRVPEAPSWSYDIRLATFLLPGTAGDYALSLWEIGIRDDKSIRALHHRQFLPAPFAHNTRVEELFAAPVPTLALFPDDRRISYHYKAASLNQGILIEWMINDHPLQPMLLTRDFPIDPKIGR